MGKIVKKKDHGGSRYKKADVSNILHNWAKDIYLDKTVSRIGSQN